MQKTVIVTGGSKGIGFSLGTNQWWGTGEMSEFKQRTGLIGLILENLE